jgi:[NiFe] hydrogenase assembly HybE family chaperone
MTETDLQLTALTGGLVRHFRHVAATRMTDVPIVNPAVGVEAVGFERTAEGFLGVLVTPWFISLMLLPLEGDDWQERQIGSETTHAFPSGNYVFQVAGDDAIGTYQTCSLLSPVLELADHATAVAVARAALLALHDEDQRDSSADTRAGEIARRWHAPEDANAADTAMPAPTGSTDPAQAEPTLLSRRAFIGGRLFDSDRPAE